MASFVLGLYPGLHSPVPVRLLDRLRSGLWHFGETSSYEESVDTPHSGTFSSAGPAATGWSRAPPAAGSIWDV